MESRFPQVSLISILHAVARQAYLGIFPESTLPVGGGGGKV